MEAGIEHLGRATARSVDKLIVVVEPGRTLRHTSLYGRSKWTNRSMNVRRSHISVVTSSTIPHSQLNKRWCALSYHRVREAIAARMYDFWHVPGSENPADILRKHWAYHKVADVLKPILFWRGDTADIPSHS